MKKALSLIFSGIIMLPAIAWGASAVKTLGGAGTYTGVTSVGTGATSAKTGTRVLRAGSVRTPAVKSVSTMSTPSVGSVAKTGTTTTSGNSQNRMSIGKYLSGTGVVSASSGSSTSGVPSRRADELEQDIQALYDELEELKNKGYIAEGDIDAIIEDYLKDADLDLEGYLTEGKLDTLLERKGVFTDENLDLSKYLTTEVLKDLVTKNGLNDSLDGYVKTDVLDNRVASQVTSALENRDLVTGEFLDTSLGGYVPKDTLKQLAYRSYIDTIVDRLELAQSGLSDQIEKIQGSNMPVVPTCVGDEPCTYMLSNSNGETQTWKQMSVVKEFKAEEMN